MAQLNLIIAWAWIGLGFLSGMVLGFWFNREHWLGGYASWKRRLYRLSHISFFGLGMVNLMFYLTARVAISPEAWGICGIGFVVGALTMPVCCVVMAHFPKAKGMFAVPVLSLLFAGVMTVVGIVQAEPRVDSAHDSSARSNHFVQGTNQDAEANAATTALAADGL